MCTYIKIFLSTSTTSFLTERNWDNFRLLIREMITSAIEFLWHFNDVSEAVSYETKPTLNLVVPFMRRFTSLSAQSAERTRSSRCAVVEA